MAKRSNNFNSNRPHPYGKSYDSPNSSLVTRLTSRVTGMLPQPSGWLSRWLTPAEQEQQNQLRDVQDDDDDIVRQQRPPAKKLKLMTTPNDSANQQNHVRRGSDLELSPILRDRPTPHDLADGPVAGPSGLHLRGSDFVASTPAMTASAEPTVKVNGDEGSDGSETTSGCSSLVPQVDRTPVDPFQSATPKSSETPKFSITPNSLDSRRFLFTTRNRSTDMSNSFSRKRPTFDIHAFNNPLNKSSSSLNSTLNNQTLQSDRLGSPFYRGRTMYGGSSSCVNSLSLSVVSASPKISGGAKRVCVRPTATPASANQCEISTTAERILRAIEQFSSPVANARKIPVRSDSSNRKRKALPMPFEDLVIPTVPDLLRMKRKERAASESSAAASMSASAPTTAAVTAAVTTTAASSTGSSAVSSASLSSTVSSAASTAVVSSAAVAVAAPVTTPGSTASSPNISLKYYQLPPPIQPLSTRDDEGLVGKVVKMPRTETASAVQLPAVPLSVPSLPAFRSSLPATATTSTRPRVSSSSAFPAFSVSTVSSAPTFTLSFSPSSSVPKAAQKIVKSEFKFSSPIECEKPISAAAIKPNLKFREPQDAKSKLSPITNHSVFKSLPQEVKSPPKKDPIVPDKSLGSAANFFKSATKEAKQESKSESLGDKFKPASGNWTCDTCLVSNPPDKVKCCCCETPKAARKGESAKNDDPKGESSKNNSAKGESAKNESAACAKCSSKNPNSCDACGSKKVEAPMFAKNPNTWECLTCLVNNKASDSKCVACTAARPGGAKADASKADASKDGAGNAAAPPLNALFKKDAKSWECSVCMVNNKASDNACVACGAKNPKASSEAKPAPKFTFGMPQSPAEAQTPAPAVKTGFSAPAPFSFGIPQENAKIPNNVESGFSFGSPKTRSSDESQKSTPTTAEDKVNAKEPKDSLVFSFGGSGAKNSTESISTSFQFSAPKSEKSIFGSTSNAASSSTDAKAPTEKFGPVSTGVSSTTDPATSQGSNFAIFGQTPTTKASIFGSDKKPTFVGSGGTNSAFSATSETKPFVFKPESDKFGPKESGGLFGMTAPASDPKSLFSPKKGFFNTTESTDNKSIFGGVKPDFGGAKPDFGGAKPDFGSGKTDFTSVKPDFGSTKPDFGSAKPDFSGPKPANDFHLFGSQTVNSTATNEQPKAFGASPFVFKGSEAAPKATFAFPAQNSAPAPNFGFNNVTEPAPMFGTMAAQSAQVAPMFGSMAQPMFNSQQSASPAPFAFGAQPQQQIEQPPAPAFGFPATQPQAAATPFSFTASNSMSTPTPAQPPTFDPNIKPCFNFTSGAIPSFTAPPSTSTDANPQRKIRRAIRRTQQPR